MHRTHPEPDDAHDDRWARLAGVLLMVSVLVAAGLLSALTAMRFAIRGQEVGVPDLVGKSQVEAARILAERGLELRLSSRRFSSTVPKDRIMDQIPAPGSRLKLERGVKVLLSLGERQFSVPDLEGASVRATQLMLTERGLSVGNTLFAHTDAGEASTIVHQSPPAGDIGGSDPAVNVLVSLGPPAEYYVMPDLTGRRLDEVVEQVRNEGFRLGEVTYDQHPGIERGRIVQQQPPVGYKLSRSDPILLEVSQ